ncbi:Trk system potassium uptake protein [Iodidimonas gelatinilytica]|uniref:Trk system potassium uptake protein n=2 Tax=Iodidimonas gelatinilytica TaxID=1236966 RepID=A0A5A7MSX7_9PROT|nr:Trk system potassium uptake protein [Iodidimonas gelatinilytica]GEQ99803.1 Trk system potassium uptake protein [Iodidimonas gelatinilytica]
MIMIDFRPILNICGLLMVIMAVAMIFPALADIASDNPDFNVFITTAALTAFIGGALYLATRTDKPTELSRRQAFALTTGAWVSVSFVGALPFVFYGGSMSWADAIFESVSGITTTGATVISGLEAQPPGILLWRHVLQWIGGVGVILMAIIMLPFLGVGGMQLFETENSERSGRIVPRARQFVVYISAIYSALTIVCMAVYMVLGMGAFDALCHAMSTIATGGFSTHDASFGYFESAPLQWAGTFFMVAGGIPFVAYIRFVRGRGDALFGDVQIRAFLIFLAVVSILLGLWLSTTMHANSIEEGLRMAAFNVVSIVTTTGFATSDYSMWGTTSAGLFFALLFVGGCTGSTSGGIKIYRHQILWTAVRSYVRQLTSPHRVDVLSYGDLHVTREVQASVLAFLAVFVGAFSVTAVLLAAMGLDLVTAISASATAFSNVGPGIGDIIGPSGNFGPLVDEAKWVLSGAMLLGRLELFTVLVLLDPDYWRG